MIGSDLFVVPNTTQNSRIRWLEQFRTAFLWVKKRKETENSRIRRPEQFRHKIS